MLPDHRGHEVTTLHTCTAKGKVTGSGVDMYISVCVCVCVYSIGQ